MPQTQAVPQQEFVRTVQAQAPMCRALAKEVREFLSSCIRDDELLSDLELIATEALANVVRHAYEEPPPGDMEVRVMAAPGSHVEVRVTDWGRGMDTEALPAGLPDPNSEGGRGLLLMRALADEMTVQSEGGHTVMTIRKRVKQEAWACK